MVERVKPSELFGVHVPALALWALLGLMEMGLGLEYEFEYEDNGNCPRECKSPIEAVARRTPIRDKSAMSSTAAGGTCIGVG